MPEDHQTFFLEFYIYHDVKYVLDLFHQTKILGSQGTFSGVVFLIHKLVTAFQLSLFLTLQRRQYTEPTYHLSPRIKINQCDWESLKKFYENLL